jgi:hypothetical protein
MSLLFSSTLANASRNNRFSAKRKTSMQAKFSAAQATFSAHTTNLRNEEGTQPWSALASKGAKYYLTSNPFKQQQQHLGAQNETPDYFLVVLTTYRLAKPCIIFRTL